MDEEELSSDSSDEDYVPTENQGLSEEEDSGDEEDFPAEEEETEQGTKKRGSKKGATKNKPSVVSSRKRRGGIKLPDDDSPTPTDNSHPTTCTADDATSAEDAASLAERTEAERKAKEEAEAKAKADLLWADFMKDVSSKPKPRASIGASSIPAAVGDGKPAATTAAVKKTDLGGSTNQGESSTTPGGKVVIVKEFKFAGETVTMSSTVDANSKEAKQELGKGNAPPSSSAQSSAPPAIGVKRPGGLGSVLSKIDKRPKMSTLVKSKLDWEGFKSAEGIDDDLKIHNRGKDGFLERQAFLERTDHRQFEIEKNLRLGAKRK